MAPALLAGFLVLVLVVPSAMAQAVVPVPWDGRHHQQNDARDPYYIDGQLGWQDEGVISWQGDAADGIQDVAPLHPASEITTWAGWSLYENTGGSRGGDMIPALAFESQPFPEDIYVNVGRVVQVNVMAKVASGCLSAVEQFSLEARINGEIWGGMPRALADNIDNEPMTDPSPPPGWCLLRFRFHSEVDVIEAGDMIALTIFYHHSSLQNAAGSAPRMGFGPDHASTIHVPFYPLDEAALRRPEFQSGSEVAPVMAGIGGGALAALFLVPRGQRRALLALLLVAPMLAGCSSSSQGAEPVDEGPSGSQEYTIEKGDPDGTANGTGTIVGLVYDVRSIPVSQAHVALLGTDFSAQTDKRGKFTFGDLVAGTYQYRIDHADHRSFEAEVEVEQGSVTRLDVLLQHRDNRTGDELRHRHSLFPPSGQKVIFNDVVATDVVCASVNEGFILRGDHCQHSFSIPKAGSGEDPLLVFPGTQNLEVTISWEGGTAQRAGVFFIPNSEPWGFFDLPNRTVMWPKENGETTTIPVPWELQDNGHQRWTTWQFGLWIPVAGGSQFGGLPEVHALTMDGDVHVKIEAFEGVVPLEPPHKDHWKGEESLLIVEGSDIDRLAASSLVPSETQWLEITLERDRRTLGENEGLYYTAADSPSSGPDRVERRVEFPDPEALEQHVQWPLIKDEADPPYAKQTQWEFRFLRESDTNDPEYRLAATDELAQGQVLFTLTVVAHRTDVPGDAAER